MSFLSKIVGFFTGGSNTANSVIDGVKRAGDMLVFTDEEKSLTNQKGMELFIKYQEATLPQNVTRRMIAIVVVLMWVVLVTLTVFVALIGLLGDITVFRSASDYLFKFLTDIVMVPFSVIIGFYFLKRIVQN